MELLYIKEQTILMGYFKTRPSAMQMSQVGKGYIGQQIIVAFNCVWSVYIIIVQIIYHCLFIIYK